jgi:hypothetical protein
MRREMRIHCDAKCDSAGVRIRQHGAAQNTRIRGHHSGCCGFVGNHASYQNGLHGLQVGSTGLEQPAFRAGNTAVVSSCDAKCDAISSNRIELLTRAVILVAGMNLAEAERAAVLARVIADLTSPTTRIPE